MSHPWDKMEGEGKLAWQAFKSFLRLRDKEKAAKEVRRSGRWARGIANKFDWCKRAAAYDRWYKSIELTAIEPEIQEITKEHLKLTGLVRQICLSEFDKYAAQSVTDDSPVATLKDLRGMLKDMIQLERLILGEPTDRTESKWDLSGLSPEEIRALRDLKAKANVPK